MADVVFHSSGTTGAAKEIVRSESSLQDDAHHLVRTFPEVFLPGRQGRGPRVVASVRPEHMYGALWRVRVPAVAGLSVEPETLVSVEGLTAIAGRGQELLFVTTPSFLEKAVRHPDFPLLKNAFRAIVTSGSPLRRETALAVRDAVGVCPLEIYGSTETGTVAWRRQCESAAFTLVPEVSATVDANGCLVVDSPFAMMRPLVMGDRAERLDAHRFALRGRADRRVKILERFVSLGEVEMALAAHPFVRCARVESFGDDVPRLGALVVLKDAGLSAVARDGRETAVSSLRAYLKGRLEDVAIPRRFRFVRELPVNEQGKTTASAVRAALCAWCREPIVTGWRVSAESLEADLVFPSDMECFQGHFPGFPILPGVAQLCFLRHFARQVFPDWPDVAVYKTLKFQKIIRPGVPVTMKVSRCGEGAFAFELALAAGRSTSGSVIAANPSCACPHAQSEAVKGPVACASEGRRTTGLLTVAFASLFMLFASATPRETFSPAVAALQRALVSSANWTMERRIGAKGRALVSSGTVECVAKSGIVWRVTAPFESSVAMTTNAMVFTDEEGVRVKPLAALPHYAEIRERTDAFVAGETRAFDGIFEIDAWVGSDGGWRLKLKPEVAEMRRYLFSEIDLTGAALPTNAVLRTADGGTCSIRFSASGK